MPRRPTEHNDHVPLWLIPAVLLEWIKKVGEDLEWVRIRRTARHYAISIRTRPIRREFSCRTAAASAGCGPVPDPGEQPAPGEKKLPGADLLERLIPGAKEKTSPDLRNRKAPGPEAGAP